MKQPFSVDLIYTVGIVTNNYEVINIMNELVHDQFKSISCYIQPNGHFMSMNLEDISDESEYNANDRQYFAQTYDISVLGYIITEKDFDIEIKPIVTLQCIGDESLRKKPRVEIEEFEIMNSCEEEKPSRYYQQPTRITIAYDERESLNSEFTIDCDMNITKIYGENIRTYHIKVNDEVVEMVDGSIKVKENDVIAIKVKKINSMKGAVLYLEGVNPDNVYDSRKDLMESQLDEKNISQEIIIQ
jgi:hypothetical protein